MLLIMLIIILSHLLPSSFIAWVIKWQKPVLYCDQTLFCYIHPTDVFKESDVTVLPVKNL